MTVITINTMSRKIPGLLPAPPKTEIDGKIENLSSKTIPELQELLERQKKILKNKAFVSKLPDKGAKLLSLSTKIQLELKIKLEAEDACKMLHKLNLNPVDEEIIQNIEWNTGASKLKDHYLDSDDDSDPEEVLSILSQSTAKDRIVKVLEPQKRLITSKDLEQINEMGHIRYLVDITEKNATARKTHLFKPHKTTKTDVHKPSNEKLRKQHKNWEVTSATPPPIKHSPAQILTLEESLKLQQDQNRHLKEVESQHAAEKLLSRSGFSMGEITPSMTLGKYRDVDSEVTEDSDPEGSDKEVHDEEPERGGVIVNVMN